MHEPDLIRRLPKPCPYDWDDDLASGRDRRSWHRPFRGGRHPAEAATRHEEGLMARRAEDVRKGPATAAEAAHLYDQDFYAWTQEQAQALRTHFRGDNRLDVEHLAEEIEDLGTSELKALESQVVNILAHFLKLDYSSLDWPRNHWRQEIFTFRNVLQRRISGGLKRLILHDFDQLCASARESAAVSLIESEPDLIRRLPKNNPYDWAAIESRHDLRSLLAEQESAADAPKRRRKRKA